MGFILIIRCLHDKIGLDQMVQDREIQSLFNEKGRGRHWISVDGSYLEKKGILFLQFFKDLLVDIPLYVLLVFKILG